MLQEKRITRVETSDALTRFSDLRSLVHPLYLAFEFDRVAAKFASVEVFVVHVDGVDLVIVVGRVVVDALRCVAAGGVNRDFVSTVAYHTAATLLVNRA